MAFGVSLSSEGMSGSMTMVSGTGAANGTTGGELDRGGRESKLNEESGCSCSGDAIPVSSSSSSSSSYKGSYGWIKDAVGANDGAVLRL